MKRRLVWQYDYKRTLLPKYAHASVRVIDGDVVVTLKPHASTKTKLHELGHIIRGHTFKTPRDLSERVEFELEAELGARVTMNKEEPLNENAIRAALYPFLDEGYTPQQLVTAASQAIRRLFGFDMSREDTRELLDILSTQLKTYGHFKSRSRQRSE